MVPAALAAKGFTMLRDQRTRVMLRGEAVDVVGLRFWTRRLPEITRVVKGAGPTTIMLAHDPRRLREAATLDVQLVLAGHTHGGQVVLPGMGAVAARTFPGGLGREHRRQLHAVREPRRRYGVRASAHQLPARGFSAGAPNPHAGVSA